MINTRKIAAEYRLSHWAQIMRERTQNGLSIRTFCAQAGISENTYFYWQRRVREAACQELLITESDKAAYQEPLIAEPQTKQLKVIKPVLPKTDKPILPSGWAVCEPEEDANKEKTLTVEINKCRISINTDFDPETLSKVCRVLVDL